MPDGKPEGASEAAIGWALIAVVLAALAYLVWWFWSAEISSVIRWIRYGEMWLVTFFVDDDFAVNWNGYLINFREWFDAIPGIPAEEIDKQKLGAITALALIPLKWVFAGIIFLIGIWAYTKGPGSQYITRFDLDGLINHQAKVFPVISPFVKFNPSNQPPRAPGSPVPAELPLFAEALGPEEWLAYNVIPVPDGQVNEDAAFKAFAKQLGQRWKGAKNLAPYKQILLATFCLKAVRQREAADDMLGRLARCWSSDKGLVLSKDRKLLSEAKRILGNKELAGKVLANCNQHAWQTTAMMRGLLTARDEGGVLAPAQFVWLRGHDRALWYPLNNLGRRSYHMDALGAMAQFKAEKMAERPIPKPKVEDAVKTIVAYVASEKMRPIPQLDYSGSKKRGVKKLKTAKA